MAFATRQLRNLTSGACNPMRVSPLRLLRNEGTRRYCSNTFPVSVLPHELTSMVEGLLNELSPSVVALLSYFSETPEIPRLGTGVFVDPSLILTSARNVGNISTVFNSDRRSILHNCFIGRTIALTDRGDEVICTTPVAVNFTGDVAVLRVLNPEEGKLPAPCAVANSIADDYSPLTGIARHEHFTALSAILPGVHRMRAEKRGRPKAPWPLDDKLEWVDYNVGERSDSVDPLLADKSGSPYFNVQKEVVGMASWTAEIGDGWIKSFAVPPSCIRSIIDYAKTKGPHDPVIMDPWINAHSFPDHDPPISKECVPRWRKSILLQMYMLEH